MVVNNIEQLMQQAYDLLSQQKLMEAEKLFFQICNQDKKNTAAHFSLCKIYAMSGDINRAIVQANKVVTIDKNHGEAWLALSSFYADKGELQQAEQASKTAISLLPHIPEAKMNLANVLISQNKHDEATIICNNIKALNPTSSGMWHSLGLAYQAMNMIQDAKQCLIKVTTMYPNNAAAYCTLGEIYAAQEDISQALICFEKSRKIEPANPRVHFELGKVLLPNNSPEHWQLIQNLQQDYHYRDVKEASDIAISLATDFNYGNSEVEQILQQFFKNYDSSSLYPTQWWTDVLGQFTDKHQATDTALRSIYASVFSWSLPCEEALNEIAAFSENSLASYGSGAGYWEYLLAKHFAKDIKCHDMLLGHRFTPMKQVMHSDVTVNEDDTLFLSWLPAETGIDSAIESLLNQCKPGQKLILVGEPADEFGYPRTCGTHRFFRYLGENFIQQKIISLPNYSYFNDCVAFYVRKTL